MGEGKEVQGEHLPSELRSLTLSKKGKEDWCTRQAGRNCPIYWWKLTEDWSNLGEPEGHHPLKSLRNEGLGHSTR